jgi:hypothetical protein
VRNAPENLLLSAKRRRPCRACPCECRPAPQKEVLGRSICYPSTRRSAWTNRRRGSGYLLFLVPRCSWGEGGAGRHEQPEGNGATWSGHDENAPAEHGSFTRPACSPPRASRTNRALARAFRRSLKSPRALYDCLIQTLWKNHRPLFRLRAYNKGKGKQLCCFPLFIPKPVPPSHRLWAGSHTSIIMARTNIFCSHAAGARSLSEMKKRVVFQLCCISLFKCLQIHSG